MDPFPNAPPPDYRERKFKVDLENLCSGFIKAGGDAQVGSALLMRTASDVLGIAVLHQVQSEFQGVLAWLVNEVTRLKEKMADVPTHRTEQGEAAAQWRAEDGQDGGPAEHRGDAGEGRLGS